MRKVLFLLLLFPLAIMAQGTGTISGKIIDGENDEPLGFATISVTRAGSSAPTSGATSDDDGSFLITGLQEGDYTVQFTFVGYMSDSRKVSITSVRNKINLGNIVMKSDKKMLKEVVVTEQRSQMSFEIDKRVFTVDQSIASTGGSASDVLVDIPSVEISNEGAVSLRGSESVTIWINGKASGLTADNQGDILQQMPAGSIEKIEVITNPSAKHSPEGTAGIINIILKRDRKAGYYGSAQAGADSRGGYNAGANINFSSGKFDAYGGLNYRNMSFENEGYTKTRYFGSNSYQNQDNSGEHGPNNIFGRAGFTWRMTEKDELYANLMGMYGKGKHNNHIVAESGNIESDGTLGAPNKRTTRSTSQKGSPRMYNVELGYTHRWSDTHFIDFSVGHHVWSQKRDATYRQTTEIFAADTMVHNSYQFQDGENRSSSTEIKLDYEYKINDNHRIEAGYKGDFSDDKSPVITYNDESHSEASLDRNLYNKFRYKQDTHAFYGTYSGRIGKLGFQVGLRGEYWRVKTRSYGYTQEQNGQLPGYESNDFFKLFPSAFLSYQISEGQEIQANYTRRLRRPWGGQLNSFQNISDSTNISFGNPELTPEYSNAYELNYLMKWRDHTLSLSGYYRTTDDVIERISYSKDRVIYTTHENVASTQSAGLEIVSKNKLFRVLDLTTTVNLFYYKLDAFKYIINQQEITGKADENFSWNARMTASVMLPWGVTMQLTGRYNAKRIVAQGFREPNYAVDLGLRKMFNKNWSISVNARDLLDSRGWHSVTENSNFYRDSKSSRGGRTFGVTLTYSFGNMKANMQKRKKQEVPSSGYDEMEGGMGEM
ncbi:MAG: TonB-dependent receptor [Bacteroidaceae bacterium]|nr:TonB-dependent receptor [Bacteroidaceae bacterium]